jgi:hypothetical protein
MKNLGFTRDLQNNAINFSNDMFNYNLQNIKAQPAQIQKIDAFDANYKRFPYLEYYSCTEEEKNIFRNKLEYNGMTVMAIVDGNLTRWTDYLTSNNFRYIKGKLIMLNGRIESNEFNELIEIINNGLFIKAPATVT